MYSVLRAHQVPSSKELFYDISGIYAPFSIRDQVLRASLIIDRAIKRGLINQTDRPLAVVGGGFAGVTAAIQAAQNHVPTYLVEQDFVPLNRLNQSQRFISGTQYDYPHRHWRQKEFPWRDTELIPVTWFEDSVANIADSFSKKFLNLNKEGYPLVWAASATCKVHFNDLIEPPTGFPLVRVNFEPTQGDRVVFSPPTATIPEYFGMVLSCLGVGSENIVIENEYESYTFWSFLPDEFREGFSVLIAGGGDGGLQDFLLLATKRNSAREIFEELAPKFSPALGDEIEREIFRLNDLKHRDSIWKSEESSVQCRILSDVHSGLKNLADKIFDADTGNDISIAITEISSEMFRRGAIRLCHQCTHFGEAYPLNQFLVLLFNKFCEVSGAEAFLMPNKRITRVAGEGHECQRNVENCREKKHNVSYSEKSCTEESAGGIIDFNPNVVVLRRGVDKSTHPITRVRDLYIEIPNIEDRIKLIGGLETLPYTVP